jgi:hypothetical protein
MSGSPSSPIESPFFARRNIFALVRLARDTFYTIPYHMELPRRTTYTLYGTKYRIKCILYLRRVLGCTVLETFMTAT